MATQKLTILSIEPSDFPKVKWEVQELWMYCVEIKLFSLLDCKYLPSLKYPQLSLILNSHKFTTLLFDSYVRPKYPLN